MTDSNSDHRWMQLAMSYAHGAAACDEVPVGAVVVLDDCLLAGAGNRSVSFNDPSAHAEVLALRAAAKAVGNYRLSGASLYVSLEPCLMCFGAAVWARVSEIVYAAADKRYGAARMFAGELSRGLNHVPKVRQGTCAAESGKLMTDFFAERRA